jgi:hypothetical protein
MTDVIDLHHRDRPIEQAPQIHHDMERATQQLQGTFPDMLGFVMFAMGADGKWSTRHSIRPEASIVGPRMMAALAVEGIRERLIIERCVTEMAEQGEI